jgi:small subunit ribosomal protein S1
MAIEQQNDGQLEQEPQPGTEEYEYLLDDYTHFAPPAEGEVLQGTVLKVTGKEVIIDFGYKSEGLVPIEQFAGPGGEITVQRGDVVDVMIDHGEPVEGYVLLSHVKAARLRIWDTLDKAFQEQLIVSGRVLGRVKGGLSVDVGVKAFMPGSQADPRPVHSLEVFVGQDIPVKVIKLNRRRGNVVVSRKLAIEQEVNDRKSTTLEQLAEGSVVSGVIKNLTDYGAFVDLGGIDGLLHVTDMSYGRVGHPSEIVHVGDEVTV